MTSHNSWPQEIADRTAAMWREGYSSSQIAKAISTPEKPRTRNSIIGKLLRMGVVRPGAAKHQTNYRKKHPRRPVKPPPAPKPVVVDEPLTPRALAEGEDPRALVGCQFPHGDPGTADFRYCLQARMPGESYCVGHMLVCYVSAAAAKRNREWGAQMVRARAMAKARAA